MSTRSYTSQRRFTACVLTLLLFCGFLPRGANAQAATPAATASFATTLTPPTAGLGKVVQMAVDSYGDLLVNDWAKGALYEYPAGGGAVITLLPAGSMGGYSNMGIAIGAGDDLYLEGNYNNCLDRFPYDAAKKTWDGLNTISSANGFNSGAPCPNGNGGNYNAQPPYGFSEGGNPGISPYYFQPAGIALDAGNNVVVAAMNGTPADATKPCTGCFIFTIPVKGTGVTSTPGSASSLGLSAMMARGTSITADKFGNIYFIEDSSQKPALPGVLMLPAGSTNVASDSGLKRVDPMLPSVTGVTTDAAGDLYISDSKLGIFFVPNPSGTPQTASATLISPVTGSGQPVLDQKRSLLYVPTYDATGAQILTEIAFNTVELGTTTTTAPTATPTSVLFGFNAAVTPNFVIQEGGVTSPDFVLATGGSCANGTAYAAQSNCTVNVTLAPHAVGSVSAKLLAVDASGNVLGFINLHGTGSGSAVQILPGAEAAIGSGLKTPSQIAADPGGNVYVADPGLGAVAAFPTGSGSTTAVAAVGTGVTAPTGVAVDGAGDVFFADSGNVYEVQDGPGGLVAASQATLKTGLGTNLKLATDGSGVLYIADPDHQQVVKLANAGGTIGLGTQIETDLTGFTAPSAVAVDSNENLIVADGANLIQVTPAGTRSTILTGLSAVTGLAVDPSGAVYVTMGGLAMRIPNNGGTLTAGSQTPIAGDDTAANSIALDPAGNLYLTNSAAGNVDMVSKSGFFNFGTLTSTTGSGSQPFNVLDFGNLPLNVTGFAGTADYTATATTCTGGPVAVGATCSVTITFNPGPGDQGTLAGSVTVTGDEANTPVGVNVTGVGAALAASATAVTVKAATVDGAPAVVTVTPVTGTTPVPTGQVTLTVTGASLTKAITVTGTLAAGTVTITPPQLAVGTYTFAVSYGGDRVYGTSKATTQVTVAAGAVTVTQPTMAQIQQALPTYPYILAAGAGAQEPYDGSVTQYEYNYQVKVVATDGVALIGQPVLNSQGKQVATNYGSISFTGIPAGSGCTAIPVAADGTATFTTDCLTINTSNSSVPNILTSYTVTPVYSPAGTGSSAGSTNPNYTGFTGSPISFTALRNPMVQISANPSAVSLTAGSTAKVTLSVSSILGYGIAGSGGLLNNYSLPLQLSCDGLPAYATCTFTYPTPDPTDPQSVDVGPVPGTVLSYRGAAAAACTKAQGCVGPGTVIMTITTNVSSSGATASLRRSNGETAFAAMFGIGLFGLAFGKRKSLRGRLLLLACLLVCGSVTAGISGCSTTQLGGSTGTPTPSGTYAVTVTAKQVGSQVITQTPGIVYGNQNQMSLPFTMNVTVQ